MGFFARNIKLYLLVSKREQKKNVMKDVVDIIHTIHVKSDALVAQR